MSDPHRPGRPHRLLPRARPGPRRPCGGPRRSAPPSARRCPGSSGSSSTTTSRAAIRSRWPTSTATAGPTSIGVGGGTCAWYENPAWKKRVVTTAEADPRHHQQRHGRPRRRRQGRDRHRLRVRHERADQGEARCWRSQGASADDPWTLRPIADVGSIHRLRWGDVDGDRRPDLVVAPIFGPTAKAAGLRPGAGPARRLPRPRAAESGPLGRRRPIGERPGPARDRGARLRRRRPLRGPRGRQPGRGPVRPRARRGRLDGRSRAWSPGRRATAPKRGSSEVHVGRLADGTRFLATVEPWHGTEVAVYLRRVG